MFIHFKKSYLYFMTSVNMTSEELILHSTKTGISNRNNDYQILLSQISLEQTYQGKADGIFRAVSSRIRSGLARIVYQLVVVWHTFNVELFASEYNRVWFVRRRGEVRGKRAVSALLNKKLRNDFANCTSVTTLSRSKSSTQIFLVSSLWQRIGLCRLNRWQPKAFFEWA